MWLQDSISQDWKLGSCKILSQRQLVDFDVKFLRVAHRNKHHTKNESTNLCFLNGSYGNFENANFCYHNTPDGISLFISTGSEY